jgi:uncharacterized protein (UPF0212 family)
MTDKITFAELLRAEPADLGCEHGFQVAGEYVELQLAGQDAEARFPEVAAHMRSCPACRRDLDGLLIAARAER